MRLTLKAYVSSVAANEGSAMIIQEHGDHLILIRQTDHAVLSGYFARELGNEGFARPEPLESFQRAATEHDNGWNERSEERRVGKECRERWGTEEEKKRKESKKKRQGCCDRN